LLGLLGSFEAAEDRHSNVKEHKVGTQFGSPLDGLEAITRLCDDFPTRLLL